MRIAVLIKQVLEPRFPLCIDPGAAGVKQDSQKQIYVVNPVDRCSLEAAIRARTQLGEGIITAITIGPERCAEALYYCLAQGADEAVHVLYEDVNSLDSYGKAFILSRVLQDLKCEVILCGNMSADTGNAQTGVILAELLDLPRATNVVGFEFSPDLEKATIKSRLEKGKREILECPIPAVLTIDKFINEPRYVSLHNQILATKRQIIRLEPGALGINLAELKDNQTLVRTASINLPRPRVKKTPFMDSTISAQDRMNILMQGGQVETPKTEFLEGPTDQIAEELVKRLKNQGVIDN